MSACGKKTSGPLGLGVSTCVRASWHDGECRAWLTSDERDEAELATLRADLARVTAELAQANATMKALGRECDNINDRWLIDRGALDVASADLARVTSERDGFEDGLTIANNAAERRGRERDDARAQVRELQKVARAAVVLTASLPRCEERVGDSRCENRASWVDRDGQHQCDGHHPKPRTHPLQWSDEADAVDAALDALPPSMLEEPSDG